MNAVYKISENVFDEIARRVRDNKYVYVIRKGLVNVLLDVYTIPDEVDKAILRILSNQNMMDNIKYDYEKIVSMGKCKEIVYLCKAAGK